jgi:pSer/pThr/pTyr-binding forkhead associated (FHA) protein
MKGHYKPSLTRAFDSPFGQTPADDATRLVVVAGPIAGATYKLTGDDTTIGRRPENTICIPSQNISKTHCRIVHEQGDRYVIVDEGSTNGTIVNGRRLETRARLQLASGDTVSIAEITFLFFGPHRAGSGGLDDIRVDVQSAASEAEKVLAGCEEALQIARARRNRAVQGEASASP